jgi:2-methylcitrate dehydratase PrpD
MAAPEVESITVSRPGLTVLGGPRHPTDLIEMAHSLAYFAAAGAADHEFTWKHASAAKIGDPAIHMLIDKVQVGSPPIENTVRYRQGATVAIRTYDGRISTDTVYLPKGAGALGIAWSDIDGKFRTLLPEAGMHDDQIEATLALIHDFGHLANVSVLTGSLRRRDV